MSNWTKSGAPCFLVWSLTYVHEGHVWEHWRSSGSASQESEKTPRKSVCRITNGYSCFCHCVLYQIRVNSAYGLAGPSVLTVEELVPAVPTLSSRASWRADTLSSPKCFIPPFLMGTWPFLYLLSFGTWKMLNGKKMVFNREKPCYK